ncbi:MAG TPA: DivIVA domain-containing protein [Candidatus Dormibacteraeota bacterium]|jgi:cell division septum initiation protein DivIVA
MSVVEQGTASMPEGEIGLPEFPIGLRGYDRQQVDVFLKDLSVRLTAERRRAEQAERAAAQMRAELAGMRNQPPPSFEHLGSEAARVLEQAGASAKLLVEEARSRGHHLVEQAEEHAAALLVQAERQAAQLEAEAAGTLKAAGAERERILDEARQAVEDARNQAEAEAHAALEEAREAAERTRELALREKTAMQAETERLRESRARMLEYLGRIHSDLSSLLSEAAQADVEPPAELVAAGVTDELEADSEEAASANGEHAGATPGAE